MENYIEHQEIYQYVLDTLYFNNAKKERDIFIMWHDGENNCAIARRLHISEGTVRNRKKELNEKINDLLNDSSLAKVKYKVYMLKFPNGKLYIGRTKNTDTRWSNNGKYYITNIEMFDDIIKYGWDNVEKIILKDNITYKESYEYERQYILEYNTISPYVGYNKTI